MPAAACPATVQTYAILPARSVTVRKPVLPGLISLLFLPAIFRSCDSLPLLTSLNVTFPCRTVFLERTNLNSFMVTVMVVAVAVAGRAATGAAATRAASATPSASVMRFMEVRLLPRFVGSAAIVAAGVRRRTRRFASLRVRIEQLVVRLLQLLGPLFERDGEPVDA